VITTSDIPPLVIANGKKIGDVARELEVRLLVHSTEVHTERGVHAKRLETWERWARPAGWALGTPSVVEGRRKLETAAARLADDGGRPPRLPWQRDLRLLTALAQPPLARR
jgi:hypothetical protein